MDDVYFDIPVEITNPLEKRIAEAFQTFDHNNVNMVDGKDIGAILRSLGCVPSEKDVREIIEMTEFSNHPGNIHLSKFMPCLKTLLLAKKMVPSQPEHLLEAFKILDNDDKGYIKKQDFVRFMTEVGDEPLSQEEVKEMMKSAVDPSDEKVHYEIYINYLINEPEDSIYKLAEWFVLTGGKRGSQKMFGMQKK